LQRLIASFQPFSDIAGQFIFAAEPPYFRLLRQRQIADYAGSCRHLAIRQIFAELDDGRRYCAIDATDYAG